MDEFRPVPDKFRWMFCGYYNKIKDGCTPVEAGMAAAKIYETMCKHFQKALKKELKKIRKNRSEWRS